MNHSKTSSTSRRGFLRGAAAVGAGALALPFLGRNALAQAGLEGKRIGYSMSFSTIEWLVAQRAGVTATAAKYGFDLTVSDAADNPAKQVLDLEDFVTKQMDLVVISTYYADAIVPAVQELNAAGIPIVVLSSSLAGNAEWTCRLAADNLATSRAAGAYYVEKLAAGSKVVHIDGKTGSKVNQERTQGWNEVVAKSDLEVVGHAVANYERSQALRVMEDFLQANHTIDAAYCNNDEMALGAMQAAREVGRLDGLMITGYDGMQPEVMKAIHEGHIHGTWQYSPMGVEGIEAAAAILSGKELPKEFLFPSPLITKDNVTDFWNPETNEMKPPQSLLKL
jgi:ribose transport system substrate-binding protein